MSWRSDIAEPVPGSWLTSAYPGLGALATQVPASGIYGPSYLYPILNMPTDSAVEIFGYITRYPTLGTFTVNENGSFVYLGATDYFEAKVYADGTLLVSDLGYGVGVTHISMYVGTPVSTFAGGPILGPTDVSGGLASSQVGTPGRRIGPRLALLANGQMAVLF